MKINENWTFRKDGMPAREITLPHDAMLEEERIENCHNGVNSGYFPGGKYVYERSLYFAAEDIRDKNIQLYFEGVYQNAVVYCNEQCMGGHHYGFTPFYVDITSSVREGENKIRVTVDNSLEPNCRWYSGSGIYRNVHLLIRSRNYIDEIRIHTVSIDPPTVHVEAKTQGEARALSCHIWGPSVDMTVDSLGDIRLEKAFLWSMAHPNLYHCAVSNGEDTMDVTFGIRSLECSARKGLCINGEEVLLRGGCIHADHGLLGACSYRDAEYRRVKILKENGYNAIRCAHNPASRDFLDACDELGMLVMDEAFDGWTTPKTYHDHSRTFEKDWKSDLEAMVRVDYNHPSVILQSIGNEVTETCSREGIELTGELAEYVRELDGTRPVTAGINALLNVYTKMGIAIYKQKGVYQPVPLPEKKSGYKEEKTGSAFFNATAEKLGWLMASMSKGRKGDRATRDAAEKLDVLGLNYAASRYDEDVEKYPDRAMVGSETMIADLPYNWERVRKYKAVIGDFAWAAWDYLGEAGIGDFTYYSYEGLPLLAGSGAIDILGHPGAEAAFEQVVWGLRKEPYLCVSPLNHSGELPKKSAWRFTDGIPSWNWPGCEGKETTVEVYTDAPLVRLYLNDRMVGERKTKDYRASLRIAYQPGTLRAVAIYDDRHESTELSTGSGEKMLRASTVYQGREISFVEIRAVDGEGKLLPGVEDRISIETEESVEVLGFGSARTKTDDSYRTTVTSMYRGRAMVIVRGAVDTTCEGKVITLIKK